MSIDNEQEEADILEAPGTLGFASTTWSRPLLAAMLAGAPSEAPARVGGAEVAEPVEGAVAANGAPAGAGTARKRKTAEAAAAAAPTEEESQTFLGEEEVPPLPVNLEQLEARHPTRFCQNKNAELTSKFGCPNR